MKIQLVVNGKAIRTPAWAREARVWRWTALAALCLGLASTVAADAAPVDKPHEFMAGDVISAAEVNENFDALFDAINERVVDEELVIAIDDADGCEGIVKALDALVGTEFTSTGSVLLSLRGTYPCARSLNISYHFGAALQIAGNGNSPADTVLSFPEESRGLVVTRGTALGGLSNLTLRGPGRELGQEGIRVWAGSLLDVRDVVVTGFQGCVEASSGGAFFATNVTVRDCSDSGFHAQRGGALYLTGCVAEDNSGIGFLANYGGIVEALSPLAIGNGDSGFQASNRGILHVTDATATGNVTGFRATSSGYLRHSGAAPVVADNADGDFSVDTASGALIIPTPP